MESAASAESCGMTLGKMCNRAKVHGVIPCARPCSRCGAPHASASKLRRNLNSRAAINNVSTSTGPPTWERMQAVAMAAVGTASKIVKGAAHRYPPRRMPLTGNAAHNANSQPRTMPCIRSIVETRSLAPSNSVTGTWNWRDSPRSPRNLSSASSTAIPIAEWS